MSEAQKRRHMLARTLLDAVDPAAVKKAVRRILRIIEKGSDKDSAQAFRILFDTLGVKPQADPEASGKPQAYVFVLPDRGAIPGVEQLVARPMEHEAPIDATEVTVR